MFDVDPKLSLDRERGLRARIGYNIGQPRTIGLTVRQSFGGRRAAPPPPVAVEPPPPPPPPVGRTCPAAAASAAASTAADPGRARQLIGAR